MLSETRLDQTDYEKMLSFYNIVLQCNGNHMIIQEALQEIFNYNQTILWDLCPKRSLASPRAFNLPRQALDDYLSYFQPLDLLHPEKLYISRRKPVICINEILSQNDYEQTEYYQDFMRKHGYYDEMGVYFMLDNQVRVVLGLVRTHDEPPFTMKDVTLLSYLIPPMSSVFMDKKKEKLKGILIENGITERESQVVHLVIEGKTNKEMAEILFVSENTIKKHLQNIFYKFGVSNRTSIYRVLQMK